MSRTYKATGINLKSMPLGEADRLVTVLTREFGLIRVVAPGARKQNSKLGGRSGLFVVNELLVAKGRSLDKITQAETLESYPGLSKDLSKLAASQYLAELVLCHALSEQPQEELYALLNEHLRRLEYLPKPSTDKLKTASVLAHLSHGVFHLLALAGVAPQVQVCCVTQHSLKPDFTSPDWRVGFSVDAGGAVSLADNNSVAQSLPRPVLARGGTIAQTTTSDAIDVQIPPPPRLNAKLTALELTLLQKLAEAQLPQLNTLLPQGGLFTVDAMDTAWVKVERVLRDYAQYHFGRAIRSATLVDALSIPDF
ncbi:MAG: DNA repair protein RecO [Symplocastrum torsivum CPER-KK1]|jgi:DNA repair protein RecO (recombination protein O)|uniref:DNA repair protein RecO n=1 Tax=Symplocastrum torsivum CPER-KK1 TaxID=450513 RepID=A0A951PGG8_9CYAN|nr:DNA repair protein RecO [Symplocastrum torsivum CPER-KK1]